MLGAAAAPAALAQQPFTLRQILSAPYASQLTASPASGKGESKTTLFAWVEDSEGRRNLFIGGPGQSARQLTHFTHDDGQQISDLAWSPDGSAIAYTYGAPTGADGHPANPAHLQHPMPVQVMVQPLAKGARAIVAGEGEGPVFAGDGQRLLFIRGGQIWSAGIAPADLPRRLVFDGGSASELTLSPDGSLLAFVSTRREAGKPARSLIGIYDLRRGALRFLAPSTDNDLAPVFSGDGRYLAWLRKPSWEAPEFAPNRVAADPWSIQLADTCGGSEACGWPVRTLFSPPPNRPGSVLPHLATGDPRLFFLPDHSLVFYSEADGWTHLYRLDWKAGKPPRLLTPGAYEVEDATVQEGVLYYAANEYAANRAAADPQDSDRRHLWKIDFSGSGDTAVRLTSGPGIEVEPQGALAGFAGLYSDARTPMHPVFTGADGIARALHPDALPRSYPAAALVEPKQVIFPSTDGLQLHGQLFLPGGSGLPKSSGLPKGYAAGGPRRPAIVFLHGGPRRQMLLGYPTSEYYSNAYALNQYLASRGFIVLSVNYRCGIGYGLEFRQCEHSGAAGAAEYNDVLAAARYLRARPDVDPKRIGIWGGSYGGYLTELALARNSDVFAAGVSFHGVYDWNLEENAGDWRRGSPTQQEALAARARASSPIGVIDRWRSPVLLIHGDDDPEVAYAETVAAAAALRARHVPVQELIFPGEVHSFLLHRDWLAAFQATAAFFERTLQPAPVK